MLVIAFAGYHAYIQRLRNQDKKEFSQSITQLVDNLTQTFKEYREEVGKETHSLRTNHNLLAQKLPIDYVRNERFLGLEEHIRADLKTILERQDDMLQEVSELKGKING